MPETNPSLAPVIGSKPDADFIFDIQLIARKEPGKGQALQRLIDRAGITQTALAESINVSRSYVTMWCSESKWPNDTQLRNALLALNIDRKTILNHLGPIVVSSDTEFDPQALAVTVFSKLFAVEDPFEREGIIYDTIYEKALIAQGIKATSDTRAFIAFTEERRRWIEEKRIKGHGTPRNVTNEAAAWSAGQGVYAKPASDSNTSLQDTDTTTDSGQENP